MVTIADGHAEREAAKAMINDAVQANNDPEATITLGADKGYDAREFIDALTDMKVIPHVAQNTSGRRSAVPDEIANTEGYSISQQKRKLIEQGFGWAKTIGNLRQVMVRGLQKVVSVRATHLDEPADCLSAKHIIVSALDLIKVRAHIYAWCIRVH